MPCAPPTSCRGSSPHTRGALSRPQWLGSSARIIPAYAGSTVLERWSVIAVSDHPRIRGEHPHRDHLVLGGVRIIPAYAGSTHWGASMCTSASGSSPHTRGARGASSRTLSARRIIPAYAGSTFSRP